METQTKILLENLQKPPMIAVPLIPDHIFGTDQEAAWHQEIDEQQESYQQWIDSLDKDYTVYNLLELAPKQWLREETKRVNIRIDEEISRVREMKQTFYTYESTLLPKLERYKKQIHYILHPNELPSGTITEVEIQRAKDVPVETLLEFNRQRHATCLWHGPDKHPSLYWYGKNNIVKCFVCGIKEDSIGITQKLYGINFIEAVKRLLC